MIDSKKPRVAITLGDINGVGPEILAKALANPEVIACCDPIIIGDPTVLDRARALVGIENAPDTECDSVDINGMVPVPGVVSAQAGEAALAWIERAVQGTRDGEFDAMVTCPISKEAIHKTGCLFSGHTDLIAERVGAPDYRMCLFSDRMRIVHITGHKSLRDALDAITVERIVSSAKIGDDALRSMNHPTRRIAIAGLNPHAGEAGAFGNEDIDIVAPAVEECKALGIDASGPHPPDTVFRRMYDGEFDLTVALYHDQGHIALKMIAMDEGVNVTLGLPIVRTSPDHGTAFDIAWQGVAREHSLVAAIKLAAQLTKTRERVS